MMKRIVLTVMMIGLSTGANASPETAEDWGVKAASLYSETSDLLATVNAGNIAELDADYTDALAQFSVIAGRLAVWVDTSGGAKDFGCIFRGMAEEAEVQLEQLETVRTQKDAKTALTRIATMLDDAQAIAVASVHAARTGTSGSSETPANCPASAHMISQYLTEQP